MVSLMRFRELVGIGHGVGLEGGEILYLAQTRETH